ncbi:MAG: amidohydrolase [Bacteroidales bacterium]|jgi:5-methylthioadenosine/S-adenosylhomocysteine deaminase|nr:amidohydrolase [Bacteroidales bacterium]
MNAILIKNITLANNSCCDVLIKDGKFAKIADEIKFPADKTIDGKDKAIVPAFYNAHSHTPMSLLRSFCEGKSLQDWLTAIWKKEATLTEQDIYNGTRLAILEMIKSGSVFFNDMYWHHSSVIRAVKEMGVRANIGITFMDSLPAETIEENFEFIENFDRTANPLIDISLSPHAIYTCSVALYQRCYQVAHQHGINIHTHLAETQKEVEDCLREHQLSPVQYLNAVGVLDNRTIAAHCVHLTPQDADILAEKGVTAVHNPCSNMKLASGIFPYQMLKSAGVHIALGTDGNASNNSLSMLGEMKIASLLAKVTSGNPQALPADEVFEWATVNSASAFGLLAGCIREGYLADCLLINLNNVSLVPNHNLIASLVYSADSECIDSVICNGKILMENRFIEREEEIITAARRFCL